MKIAFSFKMRSGKDTCVDYLIEKYGGRKITFAKPLYDALYKVQDIFNLPQEKDRSFLQMVGDWAREKDDHIFVNLALKDSSFTIGNKFCNDLRFLIEYEALKKDGWVCIKINRNTGLPPSNHRSETELEVLKDEDWDYIIDNNGTLQELYDKLDEILLSIKS
jgi:hypothetical protein